MADLINYDRTPEFQAYEAGKAARRAGTDRNANPIPANFAHRDFWTFGYDAQPEDDADDIAAGFEIPTA